MQFGNPIALWFLALIPAVLGLGWYAQRRRNHAADRFGSGEVVARLYSDSIRAWRVRKIIVASLAFGLLALAAARPQYGKIEQNIVKGSIDVIVAIDLSPSMLATDVKPNRLDKAKKNMRRLVRRLSGNRVGIVAFAGEALLVCPMTIDSGLASLVLRSLDVDTIGAKGTDLGRAIDVSIDAFTRGGDGSRVLVLLTDGEDNEGRGVAAARRAKREGVRIFAIGIGTSRGAPVPDGKGGYKGGFIGGKLVSRLDMGALNKIAQSTGGAAYDAGNDPAAAINFIALQVAGMNQAERDSKTFVIHRDRFGWFVAPALLLLAWLAVTKPKQIFDAAAVAGDASAG